MILYSAFRGVARVAIRWFYRDVTVLGWEGIPRRGPLLVAVNHPNALVDALVAVAVVPRQVTLTAKATLWENPLLGALFTTLGLVPLRRVQDERSTAERAPAERAPVRRPADPGRNAAAFAALLDVLAGGGAILIFPEGISHSGSQLARLRTGLARVALQARDERSVRGLRILPVGLVFERKWLPRSRVLVQVGEPLALDDWNPPSGVKPAEALTSEVEIRLRAVTLNYETEEVQARELALARTLAAAFAGDRPLGSAEAPLTASVDAARRVMAARRHLMADPSSAARAERLLERLQQLRGLAAEHGLRLEDAEIATGLAAGARFTVREGVLALAGLPVALWGALSHFVPLRLAWWVARTTSRSEDEPAMRTMVLGLGLVLATYALQSAAVWALAGWRWALLYLVSLPLAGAVELRFRDRARRARQRIAAYLLFRRRPALRRRFAEELSWIRTEALALEASVLTAGSVGIAGAPAEEGSGGVSEGEGSGRPDPSAMRAGAGRSGDP